MKLVVDLVPLRDRAVHGPIVKASATQDTFRAVTVIWTPVCRQILDLRGVRVLAPLPNVAGHIVKAELIGSFKPNVVRVIAPFPVVPGDQIDIVAAAVAKAVAPLRPAASSVFPLRFRWQTQSGLWTGYFVRQLLANVACVDAVEESARTMEFIP